MNEEELEEELKNLDIKEDLGEESDVTPTNSPIPVNLFTKNCLPHSSNTSGFFDGDFTRFSSYEDSAMRSGSSLSWGEDEFEGEATRIVNSLFHQLDQLIYKDASEKVVKYPRVKLRKSLRNLDQVKEKKRAEKKESASSVMSDPFASSEYSEDESLDSGRLNTANTPPPPSSSLILECKDWVENFPHLRVIGVGINLARYEQIESRLLSLDEIKSDEKEKPYEETYASNGDYENKMQFRVLKTEINKEKKKDKQKVASRICSGSSDPELLKEHVLIHVFDDTWPRICQIIEPLFSKYAEWLEIQTTQSLMSKDGPNSEREFPNISQKEPKKEDISSRSYSLPSVIRSSLSRPSSALYQLPNKVPIKTAPVDDLNNFIAYYSNPILLSDEKPPSRSLSASKTREPPPPPRSATSMTSLPHLVCPSRPVSSMSGNRHLLTPMSTVEHRPQSTSSSVARLRNKEKFKFDQSTTIAEGNATTGDEFDTSSPPWSRHTPFLPRIDSKTQPKSLPPSSASSLSYGKSLSAVARTTKVWNEKSQKDLALNAEPFVSWIVSKVERQVEKTSQSSSNKKSFDKPNSLPIGESKYYRKLSHH